MNFDKKFHIYDKYASVQKTVAENLTDFIFFNMKKSFKEKESQFKFDSVFEIGCGTGIFSNCFLNRFEIKEIILNDFYDTRNYLESVEYSKFLVGDIEKLEIPNSNLIVSSSCLQWIKDFEKLVERVAKSTDIFTFSIYIKGNLIEINEHFKISLNYLNFEEVIEILKKYFTDVSYFKQTIVKDFKSPIKALEDLKNTGVTGFKKEATISEIRSFKSKTLTYEVGYFYCLK